MSGDAERPLGPDPAEALGLHRVAVSDYAGLPGRWHEPLPRGTAMALTVVGALLVGFLLTTGLRVGRSVALEQDTRRDELIQLIEARQEHTEQLATQLERLRTQVASVESSAAEGAPLLRDRLRELEVAAGMTALAGPGVIVTLSDAEGQCATGREEDCRIQDTDLQLTVNALFALGAEALAVNGERVIATTALRSAGRSILVNYRVLASPYVVEAIGDAERLAERFDQAQVARDFKVWRDVYGLGFSVQRAERLELPAYGGRLRLRAARPVGAAR